MNIIQISPTAQLVSFSVSRNLSPQDIREGMLTLQRIEGRGCRMRNSVSILAPHITERAAVFILDSVRSSQKLIEAANSIKGALNKRFKKGTFK